MIRKCVFCVFCVYLSFSSFSHSKKNKSILNVEIDEKTTISVSAKTTAVERWQGLRGIEKMPKSYEGILLIYENEAMRYITNEGTKMNFDVVLIDRNKVVTIIFDNVENYPEYVVGKRPRTIARTIKGVANYILQLPAGKAAEYGIKAPIYDKNGIKVAEPGKKGSKLDFNIERLKLKRIAPPEGKVKIGSEEQIISPLGLERRKTPQILWPGEGEPLPPPDDDTGSNGDDGTLPHPSETPQSTTVESSGIPSTLTTAPSTTVQTKPVAPAAPKKPVSDVKVKKLKPLKNDKKMKSKGQYQNY